LEHRFIRARQPVHKEMRRRAILEAASALACEGRVEDITLHLIASRVQLAKSNLYRYFENREHIFLIVMLEDWGKWVNKLEHLLLDKGTKIERESSVASILAESFRKEARLCDLVCLLYPVLLPSLSKEARLRFENEFAVYEQRTSRALRRGLPTYSQTERAILLRFMVVAIVGLWPMRERDENQFVGELAHNLQTHIRGLAPESGTA